MSDTPETDAAQVLGNLKNQSDSQEDWPWSAIRRGYDLARKIERERNEAIATLEYVVEVGEEFYDMDCGEKGIIVIEKARNFIEKIKIV